MRGSWKRSYVETRESTPTHTQLTPPPSSPRLNGWPVEHLLIKRSQVRLFHSVATLICSIGRGTGVTRFIDMNLREMTVILSSQDHTVAYNQPYIRPPKRGPSLDHTPIVGLGTREGGVFLTLVGLFSA